MIYCLMSIAKSWVLCHLLKYDVLFRRQLWYLVCVGMYLIDQAQRSLL